MIKRQRNALLSILADMEKANAYIMSPSVAVCSVDRVATTTLHFTRNYVPGVDRSPDDAQPLMRMAKDIGSPLCRLPEAIRSLKTFLESTP